MSVGNGSGIVKLMRGAVIVAAVGGLVGSVAPAGACPEGDAAAAQPAFALHELSASGIRMFPAASAAYDRAIEPLEAEPWLADLDGPSALNQVVVIDAAQYVLVSACKNHDCAENNLVVLYSASQDLVYGLVYRNGNSTLIGAPPPNVARALETFWWTAFRE
ncbi:MAG: hypothetical protein IPH48_11130 [bacterium]|jgi:hypothetical protein|nr:hypothetical protein [bacterium]